MTVAETERLTRCPAFAVGSAGDRISTSATGSGDGTARTLGARMRARTGRMENLMMYSCSSKLKLGQRELEPTVLRVLERIDLRFYRFVFIVSTCFGRMCIIAGVKD